jgi:hypothetical protein
MAHSGLSQVGLVPLKEDKPYYVFNANVCRIKSVHGLSCEPFWLPLLIGQSDHRDVADSASAPSPF